MIGAGVIGRAVCAELRLGRVAGCRLAGTVASRAAGPQAYPELATQCDVLVEAAGVSAVAPALEAAAGFGCVLVVCSAGAFAEPELERRLADPVVAASVILPAGAVGGLDLLTAVARSGEVPRVRLTTVKQPAALSCDGVPGRRVVFTGTARQAARRFPRTSNVAAVLALAGGGFDDMTVEVIADPAVTRTRHHVAIDSRLGSYRFDIANTVAPGSGARTSALTVWSVLTALEQAAGRLTGRDHPATIQENQHDNQSDHGHLRHREGPRDPS